MCGGGGGGGGKGGIIFVRGVVYRVDQNTLIFILTP